jgi:hypothetical protein
MFDKYLIVEDSLRNVGPSDAPTGFAVDVMLGYRRRTIKHQSFCRRTCPSAR